VVGSEAIENHRNSQQMDRAPEGAMEIAANKESGRRPFRTCLFFLAYPVVLDRFASFHHRLISF